MAEKCENNMEKQQHDEEEEKAKNSSLVEKPHTSPESSDSKPAERKDDQHEEHVSSSYPLLRPSAFKPNPGKSGMPQRLSTNPFVSAPANAGGVLSPAKLAPNPFASKALAVHAVSSASDSEDEKEKQIVAPPHFKPNVLAATPEFKPSKTSFVLKPPTLQSPLTRVRDSTEKIPEKGISPVKKHGASVPDESRSYHNAVSDSEATKENYFAQSPSLKIPLHSETSNGSTEFLFGQNMAQRAAVSDPVQETKSDNEFIFKQKLEENTSTVLPLLVPSDDNAMHKDTTAPVEDDANSPKKSLEESAAAHQAKLTRPEYQEVQVATGEEGESNVFQVNAKLFVFDKMHTTWSEKGRGLLRLNDMIGAESKKPFQSRIVMRTHGSLKVILNTKVWPGMTVERASAKGIRVTGMDPDGKLKVYLIMANPKEAEQIFSAIDWRVQQHQICDLEKSARSRVLNLDWPRPQELQQVREKRTRRPESPDLIEASKKPRYETEQRRLMPEETSNDSSTVDPETEVSSESFTSSPLVKSSPSTTSE